MIYAQRGLNPFINVFYYPRLTSIDKLFIVDCEVYSYSLRFRGIKIDLFFFKFVNVLAVDFKQENILGMRLIVNLDFGNMR